MACVITSDCIGCTACAKVCPTGAITGKKKQIHSIDPELCIECQACGRVCPSEAVHTDQGQIIPRIKKSQWLKPVISVEKCVACENCVDVCPTAALAMKDEQLPLTQNYAVLAKPRKCVSCNWCVKNCQYDAIRMEVLT